MPLVLTASSRSTAVAATFWLVVLLGNNLSASWFIGGRRSSKDLYSGNGNSTSFVFFDQNNIIVISTRLELRYKSLSQSQTPRLIAQYTNTMSRCQCNIH